MPNERNIAQRIFLPIILLAGILAKTGCSSDGDFSGQSKLTEKNPPPLFNKITSSHSGIRFKNVVEEKYETFFEWFPYVYNGGGVAVGDINNDGLQDLYFTANERSNKLYLNQGNLKFKDITESAGVDGGAGWHNGVTMADINSDGLLDIYVCRGGWQDEDSVRQNLLFINQGNLSFKEMAVEYGLQENGYSMHAVFVDIDNDLDLDAYIMNRPDSFNLKLTTMVERAFNSPARNRDKLYINEGGKFFDRSEEAGISENYGYGLSVVPSDINNDGYVDLFVSNDFSVKDYLYINQKDGTFKEQIRKSTNHISLFSMGADIADINNDGLEDIVVMEMKPEDYVRSKVSMPSMDTEGFMAVDANGHHKQYMHNMLHLNQGNSFFSEISQLSGIAHSEWSWSCLSADFDNDGYRDLFVTNGMRRDLHDGDVQIRLMDFIKRTKGQYKDGYEMMTKGFSQIIESYNPIRVSNYLFNNNGDLTYKNVSREWGFKSSSFSHGAAIADLDNDGDLDIVVNNLEDEAFLYENTTTSNYLRLILNGPESNSAGLGAKVEIHYGGQMQYFENKTVRGYLSSSESIVHFGTANTEQLDSVIITWNDGRQNLLKGVKTRQVIEVNYQTADRIKNPTFEPDRLFTGMRTILDTPFMHRENNFDEYQKQVLLPHAFSKSGPFISKGDANNDGKEDFYIGGASGQPGSLYIQNGEGYEFRKNEVFDQDKDFEDMGSAFFDADADGDPDLLVVSGGAQFQEGSKYYQHRLYINDGTGNYSRGHLPKTLSSGSCVAPNDIDNDGDIDLFIGGQVVADQYTVAPRSYLLINDNGQFHDRTNEFSHELGSIGMVQDATWVDINADNIKELVVVGEWTPIYVFEMSSGSLREISADLGLGQTEGWWSCVEAGDLDADGDMDLVVGNIGQNYKFKASSQKPFEVYVNDFDKNGTNDIFLAKHYRNRLVPIRGIECSAQQLPILQSKFNSYESFALANLPEILGKEIDRATHKLAYEFSSVILENDGGKFKVIPLPIEAQFSVINGIVIEDLDADGHIDILIGGNKFDVEVETTPADASPGCFLKGFGQLTFKAVSPSKSGLYISHNVKDIELLSVNERKVLAVGSNDDSLRLFGINPPP